jgi:hypothetical protein
VQAGENRGHDSEHALPSLVHSGDGSMFVFCSPT